MISGSFRIAVERSRGFLTNLEFPRKLRVHYFYFHCSTDFFFFAAVLLEILEIIVTCHSLCLVGERLYCASVVFCRCFYQQSGIRASGYFCWVLVLLKMDDKVIVQGMVSLDSTNYSIWKIRIEDYLCSKELLDPILYKDRPTGVVEKE